MKAMWVLALNSLVVLISFVFYAINGKCQLDVGSIFYCGVCVFVRRFHCLLHHGHLLAV